MTVKIVAVGTLKQQQAARALADDYLKRLKHYTRVEEIELRAGAADKEAAAFAKASAGCHVVALDVLGKALSSEALATRLSRLMARGKGDVALLIGGADGLPPSVLQQASERWSLSALTLPHRLARVVLVEQLYRAMTILRGEAYHH